MTVFEAPRWTPHTHTHTHSRCVVIRSDLGHLKITWQRGLRAQAGRGWRLVAKGSWGTLHKSLRIKDPVAQSLDLAGEKRPAAAARVDSAEDTPYLSVLQLHVQEVEVPEDPELLLAVGVVHVVLVPGAVLRGHQARLMLEQIQVPTRRKDHLRVKSPGLRRRPPPGVWAARP